MPLRRQAMEGGSWEDATAGHGRPSAGAVVHLSPLVRLARLVRRRSSSSASAFPRRRSLVRTAQTAATARRAGPSLLAVRPMARWEMPGAPERAGTARGQSHAAVTHTHTQASTQLLDQTRYQNGPLLGACAERVEIRFDFETDGRLENLL